MKVRQLTNALLALPPNADVKVLGQDVDDVQWAAGTVVISTRMPAIARFEPANARNFVSDL